MAEMMKNKQIGWLFLSSFAVLFTGMGLFPLLPLFAAQYNASNSLIGLYFAIMYAANSLGPVAAGWLISRFSMRAVFIGGSALGLPALILLGAAQNFGQVIGLTSIIWFSGGVVMALVSILTGLHTDANSRGKAFSLMALVGPLASLVGGAAVGRLVTWQGYPLMFMVLAGLWSAVPLIGWLRLKEVGPRQTHTGSTRKAGQAKTASFGSDFTRLLAITFLGAIAINVIRLGSSLSMQSLSYSPEAVSSVAMISGLVAIPVTLAVGAYADRLGPRLFLFISYLFVLSGSLILLNASALWQFWLAAILHLLAYSTAGAMSQAITGEIVPAAALSQSLSWMNTLNAAASIVCFAIGGVMFDLLGMPTVFLIAGGLALMAAAGIMRGTRSARMEPVLQECNEM